MNCLREGIREVMIAAWPGVPDMDTSYDQHVKVFAAIRRGNVDAARQAMSRMMEMFRKELKQVRLLK